MRPAEQPDNVNGNRQQHQRHADAVGNLDLVEDGDHRDEAPDDVDQQRPGPGGDSGGETDKGDEGEDPRGGQGAKAGC